MGIKVTPERCTMCGACEMACGYHRDEAFTGISSSMMVYRVEEKKNYFGIILKLDDSLVMGRPDGLITSKLGEMEDEGASGASAKPILLRQGCDLCDDVDDAPLCVRFCPTNTLELE